MHRPAFERILNRRLQLWCPFIDRSLAGRFGGLAALDMDAVILEVFLRAQAQQIAFGNASQQLDPHIRLDH